MQHIRSARVLPHPTCRVPVVDQIFRGPVARATHVSIGKLFIVLRISGVEMQLLRTAAEA